MCVHITYDIFVLMIYIRDVLLGKRSDPVFAEFHKTVQECGKSTLLEYIRIKDDKDRVRPNKRRLSGVHTPRRAEYGSRTKKHLVRRGSLKVQWFKARSMTGTFKPLWLNAKKQSYSAVRQKKKNDEPHLDVVPVGTIVHHALRGTN